MKTVLIVLDGAGDRGRPTPLEAARKPNMDSLAKAGQVGLLDIGYKKTVNSDFGLLNLLGCYSKEEYPGRGYLEALGAGLNPGEGDVCIRGNFATLDSKGNILDRRAGRETRELDYLAEVLDGMEIDGVRFIVKRSAGHRVVIVLQGEGVSDRIIPNDPLKTGVPLSQVKPRDSGGKFTASVLNKFIYRANKLLSKEPVNRERRFPANTVLIRNTGRKKTVNSFEERFGLKACCVAGIPIANGIAGFLGMDVVEVPGATGMPDTNLKGKMEATIKSLEGYDFVFLHINGADILSHDGKREEKKGFLEKIDSGLGEVIKAADLKEAVLILACDHRTDSRPEFREYRHLMDPVPVLVSGNRIKPEGSGTWNEKACEKGFRLEGNGLLPWVLRNAET